jgi:hypothetical protein
MPAPGREAIRKSREHPMTDTSRNLRIDPAIAEAVAPPLGVLPAPAAGLRRLFHYTSVCHRERIEQSGVLRTTESNLSRTRPHAGPDVLWLTDDPAPTEQGHGLSSSYAPADGLGQQESFPLSKTAVRFVVDLPADEVHPWLDWSRERGITKRWARDLEDGRLPETWWVIARPVRSAEWTAVEGPSLTDDTAAA